MIEMKEKVPKWATIMKESATMVENEENVEKNIIENKVREYNYRKNIIEKKHKRK